MERFNGLEKRKTMKDFSQELRPREKLMLKGPESLSDEELLAILLRTGTKEETVLEMSRRLLSEISELNYNYSGLPALIHATLDEFHQIKGIGPAKACELIAMVEISKRIGKGSATEFTSITSPADAVRIFMSEMRFLPIEMFYVVGLDVKKRIQFVDRISKGTVDSAIVHPREVFSKAIARQSHSLILLHNHPTGIVTPSKEDLRLTDRLREAGKILGISVVDHIIIGDNVYFSFLEKDLL
ncbi:DNA repair protein RadC [Peptoniphilus sp. KCTC 25270]|uniref:RadC family protein n=1 Tax=Peptoniphilus sp. KCTC 25270 TaxID=2897414 RepID=UPI001E2E721C|nr:DNA repair protein RadC [Peptoniphilus sp. KCTC 25270]MCD1146909.1 DNA repair protein RadC [Peptoniphilus sp. KCTC 25270]